MRATRPAEAAWDNGRKYAPFHGLTKHHDRERGRFFASNHFFRVEHPVKFLFRSEERV